MIVAHQLALYVLLLGGVAGIVFLCWVLMHLHLEGRRMRQRKLSIHLQQARRRIRAGWEAENSSHQAGIPTGVQKR
jgi:hypothetical protein